MVTFLFVMTHKKVLIPQVNNTPGYLLLQCGSNSTPDLGYLRANIGSNIADFSWYYSELTCHYWLWKNLLCDIIGTMHYHRFLYYQNHLITKDAVEELLKCYDAIVTPRTAAPFSFPEWWIHCGHKQADYDLLRPAIEALSPEYLPAFDSVMASRQGHFYANTMICPKLLFDQYCSWLFPILEYVRNRLDLDRVHTYLPLFQRIGGFFGEILENVFIEYHHLRTISLPLQVYSHNKFDI